MEILTYISNRLRALRRVGRAFGGVLCLLATVGSPLCHAADPPLEYQVKAAFLLNFAKFVEWPANALAAPDAPISICILGDDPFEGALDQMVEGESIDGRKIAVKRMKRPSGSPACQILFVSKSEKSFSASELGTGVLTVGETEGFLAHGGVIALVIEDRRVRFDVGKSAAEKAGLKLSSKLLRVARSVEK
jgi:hypothetical protein